MDYRIGGAGEWLDVFGRELMRKVAFVEGVSNRKRSNYFIVKMDFGTLHSSFNSWT